VVLHRVHGVWRVVAVRKSAHDFFCRTSPRPAIAKLGLGCDPRFDTFEPGLVHGPTNFRTPDPAERHALTTDYERRILSGHPPCGHLVFAVSRIDPSYASIEHDGPMRHTGGCSVDGNGVALYHRRGGRWRISSSASAGFSCGQAPPGVVRSLFADCWTG
jgi:hypothetical protein